MITHLILRVEYLREIEDGEFAAMSFGSFIIRPCSLFFCVVAAEVFNLFVDTYIGAPFFCSFYPGNAGIFRTAFSAVPSVPFVLQGGGEAEVCFSVIEAIVI